MSAYEIHQEIQNRQLDLDKLLKLDESQRNTVIHLFDRLLTEFKTDPNYPHPYDDISISVLYNTLVEGGYLVTRREKNLNQLVD